MMDHLMARLERFWCLAYDMNDSHTFGQAAHNPIKGTKFANTMGGNKYTWDTFDSRVPIGGVSGVQFIGIADKIQARDVVNII
jgi:hypothetical protein